MSYLSKQNSKKGAKVISLIEERIGSEIEIQSFFNTNDIVIEFTNSKYPILKINGVDLKEYELVFIYSTGRNIDIASIIGHYCRLNNIKFINSRDANYYYAGKILQKLLLAYANLPIPKYIFFSNLSTVTYAQVANKLGERFIIKGSKSQLGRQVFLVENEADFERILIKIDEIKKDSLFFFEEFIDSNNTVRGIVTGNKCTVRINVAKEENTFKTNHGKADFSINKDTDFESLCVSASKTMQLEFSGVDTIFDKIKNTTLILEVNKAPGLTVEPFVSLEIDAISDFLKDSLTNKGIN